jgi:hypothetical protein
MQKVQDRLYSIRSHESYGFYTGLTPSSEQVLMGLHSPDLIAFRFDVNGNLTSTERRPIPLFQDVSPPYDIYHEQLPQLICQWQREMRLRESTIQVKKFTSNECDIFIDDYPSHFDEILSDPEASDAEKEDIAESIRLWDADRQFVLQWGNDYWLDETGDVVSS